MSRFLEAHLASLAIGSAVALGFYVFYGPSGRVILIGKI